MVFRVEEHSDTEIIKGLFVEISKGQKAALSHLIKN